MRILTMFVVMLPAIPICWLVVFAMLQRRYRKLQSAAMAVIVGFVIVFVSLIIIFDFTLWALVIPGLVLVEILMFYYLARTSPPYIKPGSFREEK